MSSGRKVLIAIVAVVVLFLAGGVVFLVGPEQNTSATPTVHTRTIPQNEK